MVELSTANEAPRRSPGAPARPDAVLQKRGAKRVEEIIDAAEAILAEHGHEAATLKAISERTGIPAPSVYHYFADREQVDVAIMDRHLPVFDESVRASMQDARKLTDLAAAIDSVIGPMEHYFRTHPSFAALWFTGRSPALDAIVERYDRETAELFLDTLKERGLVRRDTPELVMRAAFAAGSRLFDLAFQIDPSGDEEAFVEVHRLLEAYLSLYA